jgi:hypothetical protein
MTIMVLDVADCQYSPARLNFSCTIIVRPVIPNDGQEVGGDVPRWIQSKKIAFSNLHDICCEFDLIFPVKLGFSCDHMEKIFSKSCRDKHIQGIKGISFNSRGRYIPEFLYQLYEKLLH